MPRSLGLPHQFSTSVVTLLFVLSDQGTAVVSVWVAPPDGAFAVVELLEEALAVAATQLLGQCTLAIESWEALQRPQ